ncbi:MAG: cell division protein SepF [Clostridium sp.]
MENKNGIFKRVINSIGLSEEDEDDMDLEDTQEEYEEETKPKKSERNERRKPMNNDYDEIDAMKASNKSGKVVSINSTSSPKVILKKPKEMEDMMEVVDAVKSKKIAVVNLLDVDLPLAQRMIDYIGGACYAINGKFAQISHLVYILVGENVDLTNYIRAEINSQSAETINIVEE